MQTFLPHADFRASAHALDNSRLGNQCYREAKTLINGGWSNHPAARMWQGYEHALCKYALACAAEMGRRGSWRRAVVVRWQTYWAMKMAQYPDTGNPPWLGDHRLHASHRACLLAKNPDHYGQFGWPEEPTPPTSDGWPYWWPV